MHQALPEVRCSSCHKEITNPHELMVVLFYVARLEPYCHDCYAELHKRLWFQWYPRIPVNHSDVALRLSSLGGIVYLAVMIW
ncbi:MAG: hypothetical protein N2320_04765, partial [Candidatus Bipolaricaulota bacterium]|nr:hypothetical protein [Candidatus Bipolaricaulota bacterium]